MSREHCRIRRDAVGRRFAFGQPRVAADWFTVVGVVGDMRRQGLETAPVPQMFEPAAVRRRSRGAHVARRSAVARRRTRTAVRRRPNVWSIGRRSSAVSSRPLSQKRLTRMLLASFAVLALILAAIGIYGVMSQLVQQTTHEIGVRMALGARASDIGRMVLGEGLVLAMAGLALGLAASWWLARAASALLFGVGAADPPTLVAVSALATAVAAAASYLPARRAARISPIVALRRRV